jgi:hypothetical protein
VSRAGWRVHWADLCYREAALSARLGTAEPDIVTGREASGRETAPGEDNQWATTPCAPWSRPRIPMEQLGTRTQSPPTAIFNCRRAVTDQAVALESGSQLPFGRQATSARQALCSNLPAQWGGSGGRCFGVAAARRFECHSTAKQREQILTSPLQISCGRARHSLQRPSSVNTGAAGTGKPVHAAACCR